MSIFSKKNVQQRGLQFAFCMVFSAAVYSLLMVNQLVNRADGLWSGSYYKAGRWELSIGRWFWLYVDRIRFGLSIDPATSLISLALFSAGMICLLELFEVKDHIWSMIICSLFLSSTTVCVSLSYRYMSPTFALAFFFSVAAAYVVLKLSKPVLAICAGGILIALSMGLYQADIGCTCIIILSWFILAFIQDTEFQILWKTFVRCSASILGGGAIYVIILKMHLAYFNMEMNSYKGGNIYSVKNTLLKLPQSLANIYRSFGQYFTDDVIKSNVLQNYRLYIFVFAILFVGLIKILYCIWKQNVFKMALCALLIILIPAACNAVLLIATDTSIEIQMAGGMTLVLPVMLCIICKAEKCFSRWNIYRAICISMSLLTLYGSEYSFCFIGRPGDNSMYRVTDAYKKANEYTQIGHWYVKADCIRMSWQGLLWGQLGYSLKFSPDDDYMRLIGEKEVQDMPCFPERGYIMRKGNHIIIKVSDTY